jgi:hypothetical protein
MLLLLLLLVRLRLSLLLKRLQGAHPWLLLLPRGAGRRPHSAVLRIRAINIKGWGYKKTRRVQRAGSPGSLAGAGALRWRLQLLPRGG